MESLPRDVLTLIVLCVPYHDLRNLDRVCKLLRRLLVDEEICRAYVESRLPRYASPPFRTQLRRLPQLIQERKVRCVAIWRERLLRAPRGSELSIAASRLDHESLIRLSDDYTRLRTRGGGTTCENIVGADRLEAVLRELFDGDWWSTLKWYERRSVSPSERALREDVGPLTT